MSFIDDFKNFMEGVDPARRAEIEAILRQIMDSEPPTDWELSPKQEADLAKRLADPNPEYATADEINAIFGRKIAS